MIADGLLAQEGFTPKQGILRVLALRYIPNIALNDFLAALPINVADEFHLNKRSVSCPQGQILVPDVFIMLQRLEGILTGLATPIP